MTRKERLDLVLNYILNLEESDFMLYALADKDVTHITDKNHVYYHALVLFYGKREANRQIKELFKERSYSWYTKLNLHPTVLKWVS